MSIYVGNLSFDMAEADISNVFSAYGTVKQVNIPTHRDTGRHRGFAFVEMETASEEEAAILALNGMEVMARDLKVDKARQKINYSQNSKGDSYHKG
ncbi:hypothetical protein C1752_05106 [Acaryochloris thomasi RCC1774]|uniref:RRM domain-containing protein n=1 Tax=Acaryochloris thomasi RCC1774 TaxID=1764569 RepID=A0A2W1JD57_9CYAN|nr:RNA-binding protein [Acaryochloris thomasi]PZD71708.1 hypothetical protein C1752_05106 [Acaryochloris thomasi RCC1774]